MFHVGFRKTASDEPVSIVIAGDQGPVGDKGPVGDNGPAGEKGQTGDQGPVGDKGPQGDQGPIGDKGPTGDQGPTGQPGSGCTDGCVTTASLADLARWLGAHGRSRFLLTAPPLRMPGAVGAPVTPVATV